MKQFIFFITCSLLISLDSNAQYKQKASLKNVSNSNKKRVTYADSTGTSKAGLEFLRKMKGEYGFIDLNNKILKPRLLKLVGTRYNFMKEIAKSGDPSSPIEIKDDIFSADVCQQHNCGYTNLLFVADIKRNILHVGIREESKVRIYSEDNSAVPQILLDWSKENL